MITDLSFVTVGDTNYFESIRLSVSQAKKYYPNAMFYIYDWGFTNAQIKELNSFSNVDQIINWQEEFETVESIKQTDWSAVVEEQIFNSSKKQLVRKVIDLINKFLLLRANNWKTKTELVNQHKKKEYLLSQKPFCYLDCLKRCNGKLICLDGDAFLVNRFDDLLEQKFDVGVTLRRKHEIVNKFNHCQVLNSGVLFFNGSTENSIAFVEKWIDQMSKTYEYLIEQTSLTRLIERKNENIFNDFYQEWIVQVKEKSVSVKILPCEKYNFNWIEEGIDPKENKIIHFKGGRHFEKNFKKLTKNLSIELNHE